MLTSESTACFSSSEHPKLPEMELTQVMQLEITHATCQSLLTSKDVLVSLCHIPDSPFCTESSVLYSALLSFSLSVFFPANSYVSNRPLGQHLEQDYILRWMIMSALRMTSPHFPAGEPWRHGKYPPVGP